MKKLVLFLFISVIYCDAYSQSAGEKNSISIIPQPVSVSLQKGSFSLSKETAIIALDKNSAEIASFLSELLDHSYGFPARLKNGKSSSAKNSITLRLNKKADAAIGEEGYTLKINPQQVILSANNPRGLFYLALK